MDQLERPLRSLKNNKSRDYYGHVYELFKKGGTDLKKSLLRFCNIMKSNQNYPEKLTFSDITSLYKNKGPKDELNNERGIFGGVKVSSIVEKLILNDTYKTIEESMSQSNIGGLKGRNMKDHIFVINAVISEAKRNPSKNIDVQIVGIEKCFDKLNYEETANDLFKAGIDDDMFVLVTNANKVNNFAVKIPGNITTERKKLLQIEMQGRVLTPLKCSIQIDTIGKEAIESGDDILKTYKNTVPIPPLGMVDDVLAISECGIKSIKINSILQNKVNCKRLRLGPPKCFHTPIEKKSD